jgi:hypothetical protein
MVHSGDVLDIWLIWKSCMPAAFGQMLADKGPVVASIAQDAWTKNPGYLESSPPELVALYGLNCHANVRLWRRLKAEDSLKSVRHSDSTIESRLATMCG